MTKRDESKPKKLTPRELIAKHRTETPYRAPLNGRPTRNDWDTIQAIMARQAANARRDQERRAAADRRHKDQRARERREASSGIAQPNQQRAGHGDVEAYTPRDFQTAKEIRDLNHNPTHQVRAMNKNPLAELLGRGSITDDEYREGVSFGSAYERATREGGAINLDSNGGGSRDGLTLGKMEALDRFHHLVQHLGATDHDRNSRGLILVRVAGEGRSLSSLYPGKGRPLQTASNLLKIGLQHLVRARRTGALQSGHGYDSNVAA